MSGDFGLVYPLWTDPRGPADVLDGVVGEVGLDHLTIPVVTGPVTQFRADPAQPPNLFVTEGGWHFPPRLSAYTGGSVRPRTAGWFGKRDVLGAVCEYAVKRDIPVIFRVDARSALRLLEHEPHLRSRNAWGDEVISAGACVLNPELRELLRGTLRDLSRYGPAGFELVDWAPDLAVDRYRPRPLSGCPTARHLLDICFCPACRQVATLAGIDPEQAARSARVHTDQTLRHPGDAARAVTALNDELLRGYGQARRRDAHAWLRQLAETHREHRRYLLGDARMPQTIIDLLPLVTTNAFLLLLRAPEPTQPPEQGASADPGLWLDGAFGTALPVWWPQLEQADQLVRLVVDLTRAGARFFDFERLEEAPSGVVTWLKQAVRFARRG